MAKKQTNAELIQEIERLNKELARYRQERVIGGKGRAVIVPDEFVSVFETAQKTVEDYFKEISMEPSKGTIGIGGERYILVRAAALSYNFLNTIMNLYTDRGDMESLMIGRNFLFDIAHIIGMNDARDFHQKMGIKDPLARLSAGPIHFACTGWALVDILPESRPTPDENYYLIYNHPFSFEADAWQRAGHEPRFPVCIMSAGYSSGWCEESYGMPLTAVEVSCRARHDEHCRFIMSPPDKIHSYLKQYQDSLPGRVTRYRPSYDVPTFFERKKTEDVLRESESRYRTLFETCPEGILIEDLEAGSIIFANPAMCHMLDYSESDFQKITAADLFEREVLDALSSSFGGLKAGEKAAIDEVPCLTRQKESIYTDVVRTITVINGAMCSVSFFRDVTEKKKVAQERRLLEEQLRQSEKLQSIGELAGGIAHDFNNQLTGILGYGHALKSGLSGDHKLYEAADMIVRSAEHSADLTRQLLAFARKGQICSVPVSVHDVIQEVVSLIKLSIDKRIEVNTDLKAQSSVVVGDKSQMQNVLLNVALNARDAMPDGGSLCFETSNVLLNEESCQKFTHDVEPGPCLKIVVSDTGQGMDASTLKRIFDPFFTTKKEGAGVGMGLSAVYGLMETHGGGIKVKSEPGKGSVFELYFPLVNAVVREVEREMATPQARPPARILIIDDEEIVREMAARTLRELGDTVTTACDGEEAMSFYQKNWRETDLVIVDMIMPRLDGKDTLLALYEINPDIRAILASGLKVDNETCAILGKLRLSYMEKPYKVEEFLSKVTAVLTSDQ